jgi:propionyl-CoA carboxylase beta chain
VTHDERYRAGLEHAIDIHTTAANSPICASGQQRPCTLSARRRSKDSRERQADARERILALLDDDSFVELDALARHRSTNFGLADKRPLGDAW